MNILKIDSVAKSILRVATIVILIIIIVGVIGRFAVNPITYLEQLWGIGIVFIIAAIIFIAIKYLNHSYTPYILAIATFIIRIPVIMLYGKVQLASDYLYYYTLATDIAKQGLCAESIQNNVFLGMFPHILGYSGVLGLIFKLFGASLAAAQWFNIILCSLISVLFYFIIIEHSDRRSAVFGALLWCFMPPTVFYSVLPMTEYLFTFLLLLGIYTFTVSSNRFDGLRYVGSAAIVGAIFALANAVRPMALIALAAVVVFTLLIYRQKELRLKAAYICTAIIAYFIISGLWGYTLERALLLKPSQKYSIGWGLYVGMNKDSNGMWNVEDAKYLDTLRQKYNSPEQIQKALFDKTIESRFLNSSLSEQTKFFLTKLTVLNTTDDTIFGWIPSLIYLRGAFHYYYLALTSLFLLALIKRRCNLYTGYILLIYLGLLAGHLMVEVQPRYNFIFIPLYIIIASGFFKQRDEQV